MFITNHQASDLVGALWNALTAGGLIFEIPALACLLPPSYIHKVIIYRMCESSINF